jgi:DNA-binding MarR family transcriptional regulator
MAVRRSPNRQSVRLTYLVKQLELAIRAEMDRILRAHGVTTIQYTALTVLQRHPGMSGAQLARRSFVSAQAGSRMISNLEGQGLVTREPDEFNRRVLRITLTPDGEAVIRACEGPMSDLERRMLSGIPRPMADQLHEGLTECVRNLERGREARGPLAAQANGTSPRR